MGSNCSVWTLLVSFQGSVIGIPSASYKTQRIRPDSSQQLDPASTYKPTLMTPSFTPAVSHRISQPVLRQCCMSLRRNKDGCNRIDLGLIRPKRNIYINIGNLQTAVSDWRIVALDIILMFRLPTLHRCCRRCLLTERYLRLVNKIRCADPDSSIIFRLTLKRTCSIRFARTRLDYCNSIFTGLPKFRVYVSSSPS